jgi:hypothetical protein
LTAEGEDGEVYYTRKKQISFGKDSYFSRDENRAAKYQPPRMLSGNSTIKVGRNSSAKLPK